MPEVLSVNEFKCPLSSVGLPGPHQCTYQTICWGRCCKGLGEYTVGRQDSVQHWISVWNQIWHRQGHKEAWIRHFLKCFPVFLTKEKVKPLFSNSFSMIRNNTPKISTKTSEESQHAPYKRQSCWKENRVKYAFLLIQTSSVIKIVTSFPLQNQFCFICCYSCECSFDKGEKLVGILHCGSAWDYISLATLAALLWTTAAAPF